MKIVSGTTLRSKSANSRGNITNVMETRCRTYRKIGLLPLVVYVMYLTASFVVPSVAIVSGQGRQEAFDLVVRDIETISEDVPTLTAEHGGASRRRRPRRSSRDLEFIEFRKLLHRLRNARRGGRQDSAINSRRDVIEKASTSNSIVKKVKCGGCSLTKQWIPIKKSGCRTNYVLTPTCMGMCETWEIPDINPPYVRTHHRVCRPTQLEYRKVRLRECDPGVNPFHIVPVAKNCACMKCKTVNTACRLL